MVRKPKLVTICTACGRENVGVVLDWSARDGHEKLINKRYRMARHKTVYLAEGKTVPICVNSRIVIPDALVFEARG